MNGKTIETYKQFINYVFNSNVEQFVIFNGKESKTLCTVESANKEIEKLNNKIHDINEKLNETYNNRTELRNENVRLKEENKRLNNIINELKEMFDGDLDGFLTINEKGACNNIIEVIQNYKDKLKELGVE